MENVLSPAGESPPGLLQVVLPHAGTAVDGGNEGVVAGVVLSILVAIRLVELMHHVDGFVLLPACQFLLHLCQVGTILVVLLQSSNQILQVLSTHIPVLEGDVGVDVLPQPLGREAKRISCEVDIGDALASEESSLRDELADGFGVLGSVALEVGEFALDDFGVGGGGGVRGEDVDGGEEGSYGVEVVDAGLSACEEEGSEARLQVELVGSVGGSEEGGGNYPLQFAEEGHQLIIIISHLNHPISHHTYHTTRTPSNPYHLPPSHTSYKIEQLHDATSLKISKIKFKERAISLLAIV